MTSDEDWTWKFTPRAANQFDGLDPHVQDRIIRSSTKSWTQSGEIRKTFLSL